MLEYVMFAQMCVCIFSTESVQTHYINNKCVCICARVGM